MAKGRTAEAWAKAEAEDLGDALALTVGGWTDGLGEAHLPSCSGIPIMDCDCRLYFDINLED